MSTIWMDPTEMKSAATDLGAQAQRIQETMTGTTSACVCDVPRSMIGWLDEELQQITQQALVVALAYLTEALDTSVRAVEIETDQSLATAAGGAAPLVDTSSWLAGMDQSGTSTIVGGTSLTDTWLSDMAAADGFNAVATIGAPTWANLPLVNVDLGGGMGSGFSQLMDLVDQQGDINRTILAPPGLVYHDGGWEDEGGDWTDNLVNSITEPNGDVDITP